MNTITRERLTDVIEQAITHTAEKHPRTFTAADAGKLRKVAGETTRVAYGYYYQDDPTTGQTRQVGCPVVQALGSDYQTVHWSDAFTDVYDRLLGELYGHECVLDVVADEDVAA